MSTKTVDTKFIVTTLSKAIELNASDIHVTEGRRPSMRIDGKLTEISVLEVWGKAQVSAFLTVLKLNKSFENTKSINSSFTLQGKRFRLHCYNSFTGVSIALRVIPLEIPKFESLNLPEDMKKLVRKKSGLILVTGPTGSGKSTTLSSLIDLVNNDQEENSMIITVENPVEFIYKEVNARIVQREVGRDVDNFEDAVRDAMRQDPDIILIGELQDREAIRNAITLAETGHLVMGSLHTNGASETFDRIVDAFPGDQQGQVRTQLTNSLQGIIHQRLVPKIGGGRVPVTEFLNFEDDDIRRNIRQDSSVTNINKLLTEKSSKGLISFNRSAASLVNKGLIDIEVALKVTGSSREDFNRILNNLTR
jgi:twitching motility protein PilT